MSISLVSGPLLGFDLVRHPAGYQLAGTLIWALGLGPDELASCAAAAAGTEQAALAHARARVDQVRADRLTEAAPAPGGRSLAGMIETLRHSLITDLDDLILLLDKDILDWIEPVELVEPVELGEPAARREPVRQLIADALAADWLSELDEPSRTVLRAGLTSARGQVRLAEPDIGPCTFEVGSVLTALRSLDGDGRLRLRTVNSVLGANRVGWAEAVNQASWAALTTGRIRAAATAQLLAAQAFIEGGLDPADGAEGVWNLISGHLQACVVADVLPTRTQLELGHGWLAAQAH